MTKSVGRNIDGKSVPPELRIIDSKRTIEVPDVKAYCELLNPIDVKGIIFDMDGTLTLPDQINFRRLRERTGVPSDVDIVPYLRQKYSDDPEGLRSAMAIIHEEEELAFSPAKLQPGLKDLILHFKAIGLRLGIVTRNSSAVVAGFLESLGFDDGTFSEIITRDTDIPNKPDPASVLHCCRSWDLHPSTVLMVGDSVDDVLCGRAAGSHGVGMLYASSEISDALNSRHLDYNQKLAASADFTLSSLHALQRFLPLAKRLPRGTKRSDLSQ